MREEYINVVDFDDQEIKIAYAEVQRLQGFVGVHTVQQSGITYAGSEKAYVKIDTSHNSYEIPRSRDNDPEILDFLLTRGYGR